MKSLSLFALLIMCVTLIGCRDSGPRNVMQGADPEKIKAYKAEEAAIIAAGNEDESDDTASNK